MATSVVKIRNLEPGEEVGLQNCVETGRVIRRVRKNVYLVSWKGHEIEMPRYQLSVRRGNRFVQY